MKALVIAIWALFLIIVALVSRRVKKRPTNHYDRQGSWLMIAQYTAFFTIFTRSFLFPEQPFSWNLQVVGALLSSAGFIAYLATLRVFSDSYDPMVTLHRDHHLCSLGLYRLIRHPLYVTQMVMMVGTGLVMQHSAFLVLPIPFVIMFLTARREEQMLSKHLDGYDAYQKRTGMFLPRIFSKFRY